MREIKISQPHGYLRDSNGDIVLRFANWSRGIHSVPDPVSSVEYVSSPAAHTESVADKYINQS